MQGSIRQRSKGSWQLRWTEEDARTGKRVWRSLTYAGKKTDAEKRLAEVMHAKNTGTYVEPEKTTLAAFLERWLSDYLKPSGRADWTIRTYTSIIRKHVIPALGATPLQKLTPAELQRYYAQKRENGRLGTPGRRQGSHSRRRRLPTTTRCCTKRWSTRSSGDSLRATSPMRSIRRRSSARR